MHKTLDIILPCYNPPEAWLQNVCDILSDIQTKYNNIGIGLIIVNDGSTLNFDTKAQATVVQKIPYTDLQENLKVWCIEEDDRVIVLLPSEY